MPNQPEDPGRAPRHADGGHDMALRAGEKVGEFEITAVLQEVSDDTRVTYRACDIQTGPLWDCDHTIDRGTVIMPSLDCDHTIMGL